MRHPCSTGFVLLGLLLSWSSRVTASRFLTDTRMLRGAQQPLIAATAPMQTKTQLVQVIPPTTLDSSNLAGATTKQPRRSTTAAASGYATRLQVGPKAMLPRQTSTSVAARFSNSNKRRAHRNKRQCLAQQPQLASWPRALQTLPLDSRSPHLKHSRRPPQLLAWTARPQSPRQLRLLGQRMQLCWVLHNHQQQPAVLCLCQPGVCYSMSQSPGPYHITPTTISTDQTAGS